MTKLFKYILLFAAICSILPACKKDEEEEKVSSGSVRISAFSLKADTTQLDNLENVFFTIDLENGLIYNADSLPVGTDVSELSVKITTENASYVNITSPDGTFNYIDNTNKAINFSNPVYIEVGSQSGKFKKEYKVTVNVHKVEPDQLFWGIMQYSSMPGSGTLSDNYTIKFNDLIHCYMKRGEQYVLATATTPQEEWNITELSLPFTPDLHTLRCSDTAMFMLDTDNNLYTSVDGTTWESTGEQYATIIGNFNGTMLTLSKEGETYYHDTYPRTEGATLQPVAPDFPVSGFSEMLTYNSTWLAAPQGMIVGGRTATGSLTGAMWGYDGTTWAVLNNTIPEREGAAFFQYLTFFVDDFWITEEKTTWFVIGGLNETKALRDVWISNNYGVTWEKAPLELQLPGYILGRGYSSVILCDEPLNTTYQNWQSLDTYTVPQGSRSIPLYSTTSPTLVPYIYMFGGENISGVAQNQIWRGIINRLRFEPIP